ncbi:MAG: hypothetical protein WBX25_32085 [Rhodomicrobium sp.]
MKVEELERWLKKCAEDLDDLKASDCAATLRAVNSVLTLFRDKNVSELEKAASAAEFVASERGGLLVADARSSIEMLLRLTQTLQAKKAVIEGLQSLSGLLSVPSKPGLTLADFARTLNMLFTLPKVETESPSATAQSVVAQYLERLKIALGQESFEPLFEELSKDKRVRKEEAAAIASEFVSATSKSAKKSDSLKRIRARHDNIMDSARKHDALRGRSAA